MRLKYRIKFIIAMIFIACIGLVGIKLAFPVKDPDYTTVEDKTSRIIIESPKRSSIPDSKEIVDEEGTRVPVPTTYGKPVSPVQLLPVPDSNAPIVITPLS